MFERLAPKRKLRSTVVFAAFAIAVVLVFLFRGGNPSAAELASAAASRSPRVYKGESMKNFKKPAEAELRQKLTPLQFQVTQHEGTEPAFKNEYNDNKREGIYVDIVSGEPLFSSNEKYESGTGWPSFFAPLVSENVATKTDRKLFMSRTEVRSKHGDSHLGHVFDDGPKPTGLRYCLNSAALRFIPVEELDAQGYSEFKELFRASKKAADSGKRETATLAGGCFWGVEELIRKLPGVIETKVGYTGGSIANPNYEIVKTGRSGHAESIQIVFDPARISYEEVLRFFFRMHDPTTANRQGNDVGTQYRSAIFFQSDQQRELAEKVKKEVEASGKWKRPIVTEVVPAKTFYSAEDYHQDYLQKNPGGYTCHFVRD